MLRKVSRFHVEYTAEVGEQREQGSCRWRLRLYRGGSINRTEWEEEVNVPVMSPDINAHSPIWHSHTTDHRGDLIADLLGNSDHITLNTNTHTRLPFAANQRPTSPDITSITTNLYNRTHWETLNALNSDHLPILTTINTRTNFRLQQNR